MLPLVENSFKHGISKSRGAQQLTIKLEIAGKNVEFYIENTMPAKLEKEPGSGLGLPNLQKRLSLQYKEKHNLEIRKEGTKYIALLKLET